MRFLSVAERELRAAARNKATYRNRWLVAAAFYGLLLWFGWAFDVFDNRNALPRAFHAFSICIFVYCLFIGATVTADCLSREKRDGTLGLLFLTNLNSIEILLGKLCANGLAAIYSLLAIFPVLALPLLIGGITFDEFARTILALANGLFLALAIGFLASSLCVRQFPAVALAVGLALFFGLGLIAASEVIRHFGVPRYLASEIQLLCPLKTLLLADGMRGFGRNDYWTSVAAVSSASLACLVIVAWKLKHSWRDRAKAARTASESRVTRPLRQHHGNARRALRTRLLDINPFFWLAAQQRISAPIVMSLMVALILITIAFAAPFFEKNMRAGAVGPIIGHLFAWFWATLAIHALVLYYCALVASQRLAEDKQTGALELILCTPTSERSIFRGLWLAYARKICFPALIATLAHLWVIWQGATAFLIEPGVKLLSVKPTTFQFLWYAFFNQPFQGQQIEWHVGFLVRGFLLALVLLAFNWVALGWVGRWLGLRMKHPGFAPMVSVALAVVPPVILFSITCYLADKFNLDRLPERQILPLMMSVGFGIGLLNCIALSFWSAGNMRRHFRAVVASRFQPLPARSYLPSLKTVVRFALAVFVLISLLCLAVLFYYGYQNWRARRAWVAFNKDLTRQGKSLDVSVWMPKPVTDKDNFARSASFQNLVTRSNLPAKTIELFDRLRAGEASSGNYSTVPTGTQWNKQTFAALDAYINWIAPIRQTSAKPTRKNVAMALLEALKPQEAMLRELAVAGRLPSFQTSTNRDAMAVIQPARKHTEMLERVHFLFHARACALLEVDRNAEAADDVLTMLELTRLARQIPDAKSTRRVNSMLGRSLQPLWEGLATHKWEASQLTVFQESLQSFNLLSDYTNAIQRLALANIDIWRKMPDSPSASVPVSDNSYMRDPHWKLQPRAWWFDASAQIYQASQVAVRNADIAHNRFRPLDDWDVINGLPVDSEITHLFQQSYWMGSPINLVSFAQTAANQAIAACALERYALAQGQYPDAIAPLVPSLLTKIPTDVVSGRSLFYRTSTNGSYTLYGVGPNELDENGKRSSDDWVWAYPTNAPALKPRAR